MSKHECHGSHGPPLYSVHQTLDELAFEKGIWGAALDGDLEKLKKILKTSDPSIPDSSGYTALHYSARGGNEEVCKILLENGANPNAQTHGEATPLQRAALLGRLNIVSLLLRYKADPALCDSDGKSALHKAAEGQHFTVSKLLVDLNPNLKCIKDKRGFTSKHYVNESNSNLLDLLSI